MFLPKKIRINYECRLILTSHLFHKREGQERSRFFSVFRNTFQLSDLINYAIKKVDLLSCKDAGKIAIIAPVAQKNGEIDKYGISLTVEKSTDTCNFRYDITVITIDKQDNRHFTDCLQLNKSKYRFYFENYIIHRSYNSKNLFNLTSFKHNKQKIKVQLNSFFTTEKFRFIDFLGAEVDRFFSGLYEYLTKEGNIINKGAFFHLVHFTDQAKIYLRISIETNWLQNGYQMILLNAKHKKPAIDNYIKNRQNNIIEYCFSKKNVI